MSSQTAQIATLAAYYAVLALLAMYGTHRALMVGLYYRHRRDVPRPAGQLAKLPRVTVQLPIYNEVYVVQRLIDAVCELEYPRDLLEIQVLDDSTDDTREIARNAVERYRAMGFDIVHQTRPDRRGFKAGALQAGLETASGEFLLIFDADFVPQPGLLAELIPYFSDPRVGMVQARWEHINRDDSLLTRIQSIFLDGHFVIEHTARNRSGRFFNFNGTAGIWRRRCLEEIGGWEADTLTEDLDVSYRAQLAGWKFVYLKDVATPAELPVDMNGFKSQQHRWTKGSIETGRKLLPAIFRSGHPWKVKVEAFFHLTNNVSHLLVVLLALLLVPAIVIRERIGWRRVAFLDFPLFFGATFSFIAFYVSSQREIRRDWKKTIKWMPLLLSLGIGMSLNNMHAVLEALIKRKTGFTRTPKFGIQADEGDWKARKYRSPGSSSLLAEILLAAYFLAAIVFAVKYRYWIGVPFLLIFFNGFAYTAIFSLVSRPRRPPAPAGFTPRVELEGIGE
ncbi:MAG TPA: glycosyltransferase [Thermoanaerobaculia bacterium]|jgi:cellulose synthase/poly-beta-1,6-N-acetylglucosamine synthase-like glycosyltransferase|nr:glycosyltransferase [Thermoanaerobaculia bacterium]